MRGSFIIQEKYSSSFTFSEWKESFIRKSLPTLILASAFTEEQKIFFFYNLRVEGEFHQKIFAHPDISLCIYRKRKNILLLLHSQSGRGVSLENPCPPWYNSLHLQKSQKYSSFSTFSQWKGKFSFLTQSWIPNYNSLTDVEEELFFFFCMLRMEGDHNLPAESQPIILLQM